MLANTPCGLPSGGNRLCPAAERLRDEPPRQSSPVSRTAKHPAGRASSIELLGGTLTPVRPQRGRVCPELAPLVESTRRPRGPAAASAGVSIAFVHPDRGSQHRKEPAPSRQGKATSTHRNWGRWWRSRETVPRPNLDPPVGRAESRRRGGKGETVVLRRTEPQTGPTPPLHPRKSAGIASPPRNPRRMPPTGLLGESYPSSIERHPAVEGGSSAPGRKR